MQFFKPNSSRRGPSKSGPFGRLALQPISGAPRLAAIWLIYLREMKDQLRDRRTLFTIAVLPIMLYPLVGTLLLQMAQFTRQHPTTVCLVGRENLEDAPPLIEGVDFAEELVEPKAVLTSFIYDWDEVQEQGDVTEQVERWVHNGSYDVVIVVPPEFRQAESRDAGDAASIGLYYNVASDESMVAKNHAINILNNWQGEWVQRRLVDSGVDPDVLRPFNLNSIDIALDRTREAAFWSKLLPFIMLVWAMTGAFYPAIDLVAGEKERGTLETLLCSPALRIEIVWGKLLAVTSFSMLTALLNAGSMLVTSSFVFGQIGFGGGDAMGSPPIGPMLWLIVALFPLSMLFSALALAVAAMARSSKEGQYYLMPLMMLTLPLVMLPMLPGTTLSAGTSIIPVTGMFLLVRALVEGQYSEAFIHLPFVVMVTGTCLWLATRWARRQFESEAVLFGGGDQWELGSWVKHLWRDRQSAATPAQAFGCCGVILVGLFFGKLAVTEMPTTFGGIAKLVLLPQLGLILAPALLMATIVTRSLRSGLRLNMPHWTTLPLAVLLGVALHPTYVALAGFISKIYPLSSEAVASMKPFADQISAAPWASVIFLMALVPAICEELTFRGFIFGGLVRGNGKLRAVVVTAVVFGISHGVLQQSIAATMMGLLLGWIALRTGSVLPGILVHFTNNALSVSLERIASGSWEGAQLFLRETDAGPAYQPMWILVSIGVAITCLLYFGTLQRRIDESNPEDYPSDGPIVDPGVLPTASAVGPN